ncbi:restriction endonuclease subunit S [Enterococcus faecium]
MSNDTRPEIRFPGFTEDWEERKLGDIFVYKQGQQVPVENQFTKRGKNRHRFIRIVDLTTNNEAPRYIEYSGDNIISSTDLFMIRYGQPGVIGYGYEGVIANNLFKLIPKIETYNLFFKYILDSMYPKIQSLSSSTTMPAISFKSLDVLAVRYPDKKEQEKIGSFFAQLDNTIAHHQRKLDLLKETKKGFLQKMFPKNGAKVPEIRFPGFTGDWEQRKLGQVANYRRGSFPQPYGNKEWYDGENSMPFVQVVDVGDNLRLVEDTKQKISELAQPKSVFVEEGKVVVTLQGSIGRVAITQYPAYVDRTLLIFESYKAEMDEYYFAYVIQQLFEYEKTRAPGGTIKTITKEALSNFTISFPSIAEQKKLGKFFEQLDDTIALHQRKLDLLKETKKGFLQKMFV